MKEIQKDIDMLKKVDKERASDAKGKTDLQNQAVKELKEEKQQREGNEPDSA